MLIENDFQIVLTGAFQKQGGMPKTSPRKIMNQRNFVIFWGFLYMPRVKYIQIFMRSPIFRSKIMNSFVRISNTRKKRRPQELVLLPIVFFFATTRHHKGGQTCYYDRMKAKVSPHRFKLPRTLESDETCNFSSHHVLFDHIVRLYHVD